MKSAVLLIFTLQCTWANYMDPKSRSILLNEKDKVMNILREYGQSNSPKHDFFSNPGKYGLNANEILDYHITHAANQEQRHLDFLNHMAHGLKDVLESREGRSSVYLSHLKFSGITAKKYQEEWNHNATTSSSCNTSIEISLKYRVKSTNMTHIADCISHGVLRTAEKPIRLLETLYDAIERIGVCDPRMANVNCSVSDHYTITSDVADYHNLFKNGDGKLVPLQNIIGQTAMNIECVDKKLRTIAIEYNTFESCEAKPEVENMPNV